MPQRPHFHFVSLSAGGAVPISDPWVVLDTNVLSTLTSMAWRGYRPERLQEQRAAHLLRWLKRYNVNVVNTSFAVVEGSGFHAGGVDSFEVTRRYLMFEGLRRLNAGQLEEFFDSGEGATAVLPGGAEALIAEVLDDVTTLLPTTFGPAYLVSLQLWECMEAGMDAVATSRRVIDMLADELNIVPSVPWVVALLSCFAQAPTRRRICQEVLKFGGSAQMSSSKRAKRIQSAAWDIAYLTFLDRQRQEMEDLRTVVAPHGMLLVTDDGGLAMLGGLLRASDGSGGRVSPEALHRVVNVPAFEDARAAMRLRRRSAAPVIPDLATVRSIAAALERRLNVPPLEMTVLEPGLRVVPDLSLMLELLKALDGRSGAALLDEIVRIRVNNAGDPLRAALIMVQILTDDNARERGRESTESLASVALGLREGAGLSSDIPGAGERLAAAWVRRDEVLGNSLLRQVEVIDPTLYIPALVWVILIVQALIADTADELEESAEVVLHRLIAQLTAEVSNAGN